MRDSQSRGPELFEAPLLSFRRFGNFFLCNLCPSSLSCVNEYLAIDVGEDISVNSLVLVQ